MNKHKIFLLIPFLFLMTGCWNYNELNQLAIVTGVAIDKKDDEFIVNYMIANATKGESKSNSNETSTVLYEGKGKTLSDATININQKLPKIPYLSHIEVVIISEEVAKEEMINTMDYLLRNPESRKEIYVLISKDVEAKDTLSILTPLESFPSNNIKSNITSSLSHVSTTSTFKYSEFLAQLIEKGIEPTLGIIEVEGNTEDGQSQQSTEQSRQEAIIKLTTTALFKQDKLVYITTEDQSKAINVLNKKLSNLYIETSCENGNIVTYLNSIGIKSNIKLENDIPQVSIKVQANGAIIETNCKKNLEDSSVIQEIQKQTEEKLKQLLEEGIIITKEYKTDVFGFGNMLYKKNPNYWKKIEDKWNEEIFPNLDTQIEVSIQLTSKGSLEQSIQEEMK